MKRAYRALFPAAPRVTLLSPYSPILPLEIASERSLDFLGLGVCHQLFGRVFLCSVAGDKEECSVQAQGSSTDLQGIVQRLEFGLLPLRCNACSKYVNRTDVREAGLKKICSYVT